MPAVVGVGGSLASFPIVTVEDEVPVGIAAIGIVPVKDEAGTDVKAAEGTLPKLGVEPPINTCEVVPAAVSL